MDKLNEKRSEKEINLLIPLLEEVHFFKYKKPLSYEDLHEVCNYIHYERMEPGDTVFKQGDKAEKYYIVLKGTAQLQTPNSRSHKLIEPKKVQPVEETKKETHHELDNQPGFDF